MMDDLYTEILYKTLHFRGHDADVDRLVLLEFLQKVFEWDDTTHNHLLEAAKARKVPKILLNVEIIEAMILKPADVNGLSNPFCAVYLTSNNNEQCNTSVKLETLNPIWKEECQLSLQNSAANGAVCVEIWNFSQDGTVQKNKTHHKVKGIKGIKTLLKGVASAGKHDNKLIGSASISLKDISAAGQILLCKLKRKGKEKKRGDVKICLAFHFETNTENAFQEYVHLLKNVLLHEIKISQAEPHSWNGHLSKPAEKILIYHRVQSGLSVVSETLAQWTEFCSIHTSHPLSFTVFVPLLQRISSAIQEDLVTEEEKTLFWKAVVVLLPSCLSSIRNIQALTANRRTINEPSIILRLLNLLQELQPPKDVILFPVTVNNRLPRKSHANNCKICTTVVQTVTQGAEEWFSKVTESYDINDIGNEDEKIKGLIHVVVTVMVSLQKAIDLHDTVFQQFVFESLHVHCMSVTQRRLYKYFNFPYVDTIYKLYDEKLSEMIEPTVRSIWKGMSPLKFKDSTENGIYDNDPLALGSDLFELYISLQKFYRLGHTKCQEGMDVTALNKFHHWFHKGISHWLCISKYKVLRGIQKAVQMDNIVPDYTDTKYSSSAYDVLQLFDQIKVFWKHLAWPNPKACKEFAEKIIYDICECLIFYADQICHKVNDMYSVDTGSDEETQAWCLAVTNIDHLQQPVQIIVSEFGLDEITAADTSKGSSSESGRQNVKVVIDNTIERARNKICKEAVQKMMSSATQILMETFEHLDSEEKIGRLMDHLFCNLHKLHSHLDTSNFNCLLDIIWKNLYSKLHEVFKIKVKREQSYFKKFHEILHNLAKLFKHFNENIVLSDLTNLEQLVQIHAMDTWELVHQYRQEQLLEQKAMQTPSYGLLTVRMMFLEGTLMIEILNARNLQPISSKGFCCPYVKIYLLPESKFPGVVQQKTKTQKKTVFPIFDETFVIPLTSVQLNIKNAMVMFMVKEKVFRRNRCLGETLISFHDIPRCNGTTRFEHLEQMHLKLNMPTKLDSGVFVVLEHYHEALAREFIQSRKLKKCKKRDTNNIHPLTVNVWMSILNAISYMKNPIPLPLFANCITCTAPMAEDDLPTDLKLTY